MRQDIGATALELAYYMRPMVVTKYRGQPALTACRVVGVLNRRWEVAFGNIIRGFVHVKSMPNNAVSP